MNKPRIDKLWAAFPDHIKYPTLKDLYSALGGAAEKNIDVPGFGPNGNTCASRLSMAFNDSGTPIDTTLVKSFGGATLGTSGSGRIIFRVSDFRKYLHALLGKPQVDNVSPYDDEFGKRKGIIAFSVNWSGATGHIALWNGITYREPKFDDYSSYVNSRDATIKTSRGEFWELP